MCGYAVDALKTGILRAYVVDMPLDFGAMSGASAALTIIEFHASNSARHRDYGVRREDFMPISK